MSDLQVSVMELSSGLDLASPTMLAKPGSMLDCLNYELTDLAGYRRIDGFQRYDGSISLTDMPNSKVYAATVPNNTTLPIGGIVNDAFEDTNNNIIGYLLSAEEIPDTDDVAIVYVSFVGDAVADGATVTDAWVFESDPATHAETTQTQAQMIALESYLRGLVASLPRTPVGLHWHVNQLYAVVPTELDEEEAELWRALRPGIYTGTGKGPAFESPGWTRVGILESYTLTVQLTGIVSPFSTLRKNNTSVESTIYFNDGLDTHDAVIIDYFIVSGGFETGDALLRVQITDPTPGDIDTTFDVYLDSGALFKIGDVTVAMSHNVLPGLPLLTDAGSRYQFKTTNFFAGENHTGIYGVSGAGRAFEFRDGYLSFVYTQDDDTLDVPRHVENHHLHLALGFASGSVLLSVGGEPNNFSGLEGASEIGVGDRVTGLMEIEGTTLGVFCEQSIWSIVGTTVDNFQTQVLAPNTGCVEYTLANCGFPVYLDSRGISTLQTSARYGDFTGQRLSAPVSPWLRPRIKSSILAINNSSGVACALPVRSKNQYRLFFNDGEILSMTFLQGDSQGTVGFTLQRYYLSQADIEDTVYRLVPICATSEMDIYGVERIYVAHYNADSPVQSLHVYALEAGSSFDGNYIPHYFDTNWFFGEVPYVFSTLQGVRAYGTSRGFAKVDLHVVGQQEDFGFSGAELSTTASDISLPRVAGDIYNSQLPVSNRTEISGRGLSLRLRFIGANTDLALAEPSHVFQVLLTYSSPEGAYDL